VAYFCRNRYTIPSSSHILSTPIEYLKGVGPQKADLLKKELNIFTFGDLLGYYPYRHIDRTRINLINEINPQPDLLAGEAGFVQVAGVITNVDLTGQRSGRRLIAQLKDKTGILELTWFQGLPWVQKMLEVGQSYLVYGRVGFYNGQPQIVHPELELLVAEQPLNKDFLEPVYSTTEKLRVRGFGGRQIGKLTKVLMNLVGEKDIPENIPPAILKQLKLTSRFDSLRQIHFPKTTGEYDTAVKRLKFEELFIAQLRMNLLRSNRHRFSKGPVFEKVGDLFNHFFKDHLPFDLTGAQKRVIKEIRNDTGTGITVTRPA